MKLQVLGVEPNEPVVSFKIEEDGNGNIDIRANGEIVAYFTKDQTSGKVVLELVRGMEENVEGKVFKLSGNVIEVRK